MLLWDVIEVAPDEFEIYSKYLGEKASLVTFFNNEGKVLNRVSKEKVEWYIGFVRNLYNDDETGHLPVMFHWVYLPYGGKGKS